MRLTPPLGTANRLILRLSQVHLLPDALSACQQQHHTHTHTIELVHMHTHNETHKNSYALINTHTETQILIHTHNHICTHKHTSDTHTVYIM